MNEQHAGRLFDNYFNLIVLAKPVEDSASEIFDAIYALTTSQDDIKDVLNRLHDFLVDSDREFIFNLIEEHDEITVEHLKDINRTKREMKHSKAVVDHVKDNIEFFIGIQASDGDMIDFIRSVL